MNTLPVHRVDACDPYTSEAFARRVGAAVPFYPWSFEDIACGGVLEGRRWRVVVCSFAMHLCPPSYLRLLCAALAAATDGERVPVVITLVPTRPRSRRERRSLRSFDSRFDTSSMH